jgi:predicted RNA methylase
LESQVPTYPDQPNADLLDRVPLTARIILDVGCGTGSLGAAYRRLNPRALLLGIEQDGQAAAIAAHRLDHVAAVDVERDPLPFELP